MLAKSSCEYTSGEAAAPASCASEILPAPATMPIANNITGTAQFLCFAVIRSVPCSFLPQCGMGVKSSLRFGRRAGFSNDVDISAGRNGDDLRLALGYRCDVDQVSAHAQGRGAGFQKAGGGLERYSTSGHQSQVRKWSLQRFQITCPTHR